MALGWSSLSTWPVMFSLKCTLIWINSPSIFLCRAFAGVVSTSQLILVLIFLPVYDQGVSFGVLFIGRCLICLPVVGGFHFSSDLFLVQQDFGTRFVDISHWIFVGVPCYTVCFIITYDYQIQHPSFNVWMRWVLISYYQAVGNSIDFRFFRRLHLSLLW